MNWSDVEALSRKNFNRYVELTKGFDFIEPVSLSIAALNNVCFYHCVRESNIPYVIRQGFLETKNNIYEGEFTNNHNDYLQGFDRHLCFSIGAPWVSYGSHVFVYGVEHLSDTALFFNTDPWEMDREELSNNFLTKADFVSLAVIIARKRVLLTESSCQDAGKKIDLVDLLNKNFKDFELKQDKSLDIKDCVSFFHFSPVKKLVSLLGLNKKVSTYVLIGLCVVFIALLVWGLLLL